MSKVLFASITTTMVALTMPQFGAAAGNPIDAAAGYFKAVEDGRWKEVFALTERFSRDRFRTIVLYESRETPDPQDRYSLVLLRSLFGAKDLKEYDDLSDERLFQCFWSGMVMTETDGMDWTTWSTSSKVSVLGTVLEGEQVHVTYRVRTPIGDRTTATHVSTVTLTRNGELWEFELPRELLNAAAELVRNALVTIKQLDEGKVAQRVREKFEALAKRGDCAA
jgi:hypothetical protein